MSTEKGGAPKGNKNAAKGKQFYDALRRALNQGGANRLVNVANKLVEAAEEGEGWAIKEIADRLDGKAKTIVAGDSENPLISEVSVHLVRPKD